MTSLTEVARRVYGDAPARTGLFGPKMHLDTTESMMMLQRRLGIYERYVDKLLGDLLSPGDVYIDVGANHGYHAVRAARRVGAEGTVVAVEPHPDNADRLRENIALNEYGNATVVEALAWDGTDEVRFAVGGISGSHSACRAESDDWITVQARSLDDIVIRAGVRPEDVDVVKVDVEGAESRVVSGGERVAGGGASAIIERHDDAREPDLTGWAGTIGTADDWLVIRQ